MRVLNVKTALETLLYVFQNQMEMGKKSLILTLKHRDGYVEYCRGNIDSVFKNELVGDIECGDLLLLEHYNDVENRLTFFDNNIGMHALAEIASKLTSCCNFIVPRDGTFVYVMIKDCPMSSYSIRNNDVISSMLYGNAGSILNNVCGKIDSPRGFYATIRL